MNTTTLILPGNSTASCARILEQAPDLVELDVRYSLEDMPIPKGRSNENWQGVANAIENMSKLKTLKISAVKLSPGNDRSLLRAIGKLSRLEVLQLSKTETIDRLTDSEVNQALRASPHLRELHLFRAGFDPKLEWLKGLGIEILSMDAEVTEASLEILRALPRLQKATFRRFPLPLVDSNGVQTIPEQAGQFEKIVFESVTLPKAPFTVLSPMSNLESLCMTGAPLRTAEVDQLVSVLRKMKSLKALDLTGALPDHEVPVSLGYMKHLEKLNLSNAELRNDSGLPQVLGKLTRLTEVVLRNNAWFDEEHSRELAGALIGMPKLEKVDLSHTWVFTSYFAPLGEKFVHFN